MAELAEIIRQIGETDQQFLQQDTPQLALQRGDLRLQLVTHSHHRQEQIHFLHEAIVILEQARIAFEEMPMRLYLDLSLQLAKAYMMYFNLSQEHKFATITQQILKPLVHHQDADIYFFLAYASVSKQEIALTHHWLNKYAQHQDKDIELIQQHPAFYALHQQDWFKQLFPIGRYS